MPIIFPGSFAEKWLKQIAGRLGGRVARDFNGIIVNGNAILYRHGQYGTVFKGKHVYERLNWDNPFGKDGQLKWIDYVLLHATKPGEKFFLFSASEARVLVSIFPENLNIAVEPLINFKKIFYKHKEVRKGKQLTRLQRSVGREDIFANAISLAALKSALRK